MMHGRLRSTLKKIYHAINRSPAAFMVEIPIVTGAFFLGAAGGLVDYLRTGRVSRRNWARILRAHCFTNGRSTTLLNVATRAVHPPRPQKDREGLLGHFTVAEQNGIVAALQSDGFYVFPKLLDEALCDQIEAFSFKVDAVIEGNWDLHAPLERYNRLQPRSRTYKIREEDSLENGAVQRLIADPVFAAIAAAYIGTRPIIGGVNLWWSSMYGNEPGSDAAQLFHFDFDAPPSWLKLFAYITDVEPESGPHVYVRGSHKPAISAAREFRSRGYERIDDDEIANRFGAGALTEITGKRGTVFMADTRGFHKGKMPQSGDRLIAQLLYCSPIYCDRGPGPRLPENPDPLLKAALADTPHLFDRFQRRALHAPK
jgi:hypothetical protein